MHEIGQVSQGVRGHLGGGYGQSGGTVCGGISHGWGRSGARKRPIIPCAARGPQQVRWVPKKHFLVDISVGVRSLKKAHSPGGLSSNLGSWKILVGVSECRSVGSGRAVVVCFPIVLKSDSSSLLSAVTTSTTSATNSTTSGQSDEGQANEGEGCRASRAMNTASRTRSGLLEWVTRRLFLLRPSSSDLPNARTWRWYSGYEQIR